jgi:GTPase SAR1 family protein
LDDEQKKRQDTERRYNALKSESTSIQKRSNELEQKARKLDDVRAKLKNSSVVRTYEQPVLLVGPRGVGKTSLRVQLHAPWKTYTLVGTITHTISEVPVYDFVKPNAEPHFADPELIVPAHVHLALKIHDFPGELTAQRLIRKIIVEETEALRVNSGKNLGVVLICMFDAEEAKAGINKVTQQYYNGDLFSELRSLVSHSKVHIERLILIFNKYDQLKKHFSNELDDVKLLKLCIEKLDPVYSLLHGVCNPEKVCEIFTMLSIEEMHLKNRGVPIVLGEAARAFVEAFAGKQTAEAIIKETASRYSSEKFL